MGSLEHLPQYGDVATHLTRCLAPGGKVYADFCARTDAQATWGFLKRYIYNGSAAFVNVDKLCRAFVRLGFGVDELIDDTENYALTVRDWAHSLQENQEEVARIGGDTSARAFLLWLWASHMSFRERRTTAHRLVARFESD